MNLSRQIEAWLWHPRLATLPAAARAGVAVARYIYGLLRDVISGPLTLHAMGLVYVTILSLVPLLAVSFSVVKAFGLHRQIEPLLYQFLGPLGPRGAALAERIIGFVDNAQGNVLAGAGLLFLFLTAISMAQQLEGSINHIWRVARPRSLPRRLSEYLAVILVGPVVMVTAMTLIATLRTSVLVRELTGAVWTGQSMGQSMGQGGGIGEFAPYALVCVGFSFVYWFVPNTRVSGRAALTGGLVAGVLWAGTGAALTAYVVDAAATINIYATFAIVITALLWLYLSWLILLIGAQLAFYVQHGDYLRGGYRPVVSGTGQLERAALAIMLAVARRFAAGGQPLAPACVAAQCGLPGVALAPVVDRLEAAGLLERTAADALLPRRSPDRILLRDIVGAVRAPSPGDVAAAATWPVELVAIAEQLDRGLTAALGDRDLASLAGAASDGATRERPGG